jgi:hypothetical protein
MRLNQSAVERLLGIACDTNVSTGSQPGHTALNEEGRK